MSRNCHQARLLYLCSTCCNNFCFNLLVATIGFVPDIYSVVEGTDQFGNLTVQLISGQLGRDVIVTFDTQRGSATSTVLYAV